MKLLIAGAGMIVKDFLTMTKDLENIELVGIVGIEQDLEIMTHLSETYSIEQVSTNFQSALETMEIYTVYVALPNHLHYQFSKLALEAGKHVICEKPFTLKLKELEELEELAKQRHLILVEAITTLYLKNYHLLKESIAQIGTVKLLECNYSQYSSRYNLFKEGTILPAFNPKFGGGALMDINIYNIHFVVGLYGAPDSVNYFPNIENGVDTSGILVLSYPEFKAVCIGAKDSSSQSFAKVQGTKGTVQVNGSVNFLESFSLNLLYEQEEIIDVKNHSHRMFDEFKQFICLIEEKDFDFATKQMQESKTVISIVEQAFEGTGITIG